MVVRESLTTSMESWNFETLIMRSDDSNTDAGAAGHQDTKALGQTTSRTLEVWGLILLASHVHWSTQPWRPDMGECDGGEWELVWWNGDVLREWGEDIVEFDKKEYDSIVKQR